ncbi:MAG: hypothetical protein CMP41_00545 [Rickettsiales bacterium]|nr:hypothetical protein [Rickettsiales bacterium]
MIIKSFLMLLILILPASNYSQESTINNNYNFKLSDIKYEKLVSLGVEDSEVNSNLSNIFLNQSYDSIKEFLSSLPVTSSNHLVQRLIYKILISQYNLGDDQLTDEEDQTLFEIKISKLFDTARFVEIDKIYSKTPPEYENDRINLKKIEAFFLRNEYRNGCEFLQKRDSKKSHIFGKFNIICNIINEDFERARFNISLLKEKNIPGDNIFIDLCYNIMGDLNISKSKLKSENLEQISTLNPILLSSLQIAEISPNFEHIKNATSSTLTFILSSPSSTSEIKLYTAEKLIVQKRIKDEMLAEIYQLTSFEQEEINNALKEYKTQSPVRARSLLYQAIINEDNRDLKFQLIKALLKQSKTDKLFASISYLVKDSISYENLKNLSFEDKNLILDIFISVNEYEKMEEFLTLHCFENGELNKKFLLKVVSLNLIKHIEKGVYFDVTELKNLFDEFLLNQKDLIQIKNIILISSLIIDLDEVLINKITKINRISRPEEIEINASNIVANLNFLEKKKYFNNLYAIFGILENKNIDELNSVQLYLILKIFKDLEFEEEFKILAKKLLL